MQKSSAILLLFSVQMFFILELTIGSFGRFLEIYSQVWEQLFEYNFWPNFLASAFFGTLYRFLPVFLKKKH